MSGRSGGVVRCGDLVSASLPILKRGVLETGEVACYFPRGSTGLAYARCTLGSCLVYDALRYFDPSSSGVQTSLFDLLPVATRAGFVRGVRTLRRSIRGFVAWQEESDGTWRFSGRGSGEPADPLTTACAAAVLIDGRSQTGARRWLRHIASLARIARELPADPLAAAYVLRLLALVGEPVHHAFEALLDRFVASWPTMDDFESLLAAYSIVLAAVQPQLLATDRLREALLPFVAARQAEDGDFGGPVRDALALSILIDLGERGERVDRGLAALERRVGPRGGWSFEAFVPGGGGSLAASTALAMSAMARAAVHQRI